MDDFRKMTPRQRLDAGIGKGVDWREGAMGDTHIPSHPEMPDVTIGLRKNLPTEPPEDEDEQVTIARAEREKAANDPVIKTLPGDSVLCRCHFLLDFREHVIGRFGPHLDRLEDQEES